MSNVSDLLESRLEASQFELLHGASTAGAHHGVRLYLVGGTTRDVISGGRPADLDLVYVGEGADFPAAMAEELGGEVVSRSQFGTAKLAVDGIKFDLASARKETYARPGALPEVSTGSVDDDLARRDFSVNAMAILLQAESFGELLDPFDGKADVNRGIIRVLHPKSFEDDATRILRAVRYVTRLRFRLEEDTERLLNSDLRYMDTISGDRVRHELERCFAEESVADILLEAQRLGVLKAIHPGLNIDERALDDLSVGQAHDPLALLAALLHSAPSEQFPGVIARLSLDGRRARVVTDVAALRHAFSQLGSGAIMRSQVHHLLRKVDTGAIEGSAIATADPLVKERLELYMAELRHVRPLLDGNDLMELGVSEGPAVGELLDRLLAARLDGLLSSREDEERLVRNVVSLPREEG